MNLPLWAGITSWPHIAPRIPLFPWLQFVNDAILVDENSGVAVSIADAEREEEDDAE